MSTIIFNNEKLYTDSQSTTISVTGATLSKRFDAKKSVKIGKTLFGFAGMVAGISEFLKWYYNPSPLSLIKRNFFTTEIECILYDRDCSSISIFLSEKRKLLSLFSPVDFYKLKVKKYKILNEDEKRNLFFVIGSGVRYVSKALDNEIYNPKKLMAIARENDDHTGGRMVVKEF